MSEIKTIDDLIKYLSFKATTLRHLAESRAYTIAWDKAEELKANMQPILDEYKELKFRMEGLEK